MVAHELSGFIPRKGAGALWSGCSARYSMAKELKLAGICDVAAANRFILEVYLPAHNARFAKPPALTKSAFVAVADPVKLCDTPCVQEDRVVALDNTVSFERISLQLPESRLRPHYIKAHVRVHQHPDGGLAVFHGPRPIARYTADGKLDHVLHRLENGIERMRTTGASAN